MEDQSLICTTSGDCSDGEICLQGICTPGECVERLDCPFPDDQLCQLNHCVPDPDSPIGNQCPGGDLDCDMGEFCSAGSCYPVSGATSCLRSSDCSGGERCDPVHGFCIEDRGGCNRAAEYPELACTGGDICDVVTGHCAPPTGDACDPATELEDCGEGLHCLQGRCVQCNANTGCDQAGVLCCTGSGTQCNLNSGRCVSSFLCTTHEDCTGCKPRPGMGEQGYCSNGRACAGDSECYSVGDRRCDVSTGECIIPDCVDDLDCAQDHDGRWKCNLESLTCELPAAVCTEANEPNNSVAAATAITVGEHADLLCRGDVDYLSVQASAGTVLRADLTADDGSRHDDFALTLHDGSGAQLAEGRYDWETYGTWLRAPIQEDGTYVLRVAQDFNDVDSVAYSVVVALTEALRCAEEPGEPNQTQAQAANAPLAAGTHERTLCGAEDEDYFQITLPARNLLQVTATFDSALGNVNLGLYSASGSSLTSTYGSTSPKTLRYRAGEAEEVVALRVYDSAGSAAEPRAEPYTLGLQISPPPACTDPFEPNDSDAAASPVTAGSYEAQLCHEDDEDYYAITVPAGKVLAVSASFDDDSGNLSMQLYDAEGDEVDSGYGSSGVASMQYRAGAEDEQVQVVVYYGWGYDPDVVVLPYTLDVQLNDPPPCVDGFEPNESLARAAALTAGDHVAAICHGGDLDYYALTLPPNHNLDITISFDSSAIDIDTKLLDESGSTLTTSAGSSSPERLRRRNNGDTEQRVVLYVYKYGSAEIDPEPYQLAVRIDELPPCVDQYEPNESTSQAVALGVGEHSAAMCNNQDVDTYALALPSGGDIDASVAYDSSLGQLKLALLGPTGQTLDSATGYSGSAAVGDEELAAGTYYLQVRPASTYTEISNMPYRITLRLVHACLDDVFEGEGNNKLETATVLRGNALEALAVDQGATLCDATDEDWYEVVLLGDELLEARLSGPPSLRAELYSYEEQTAVQVAATRPLASTPSSAEIGLSYHVPGRGALYYLRVLGGDLAHRNYAITLRAFDDPCDGDALEYNDVASYATPVEEGQLARSAMLCPALDVDVYAVTLQAGGHVTALARYNATSGDIDLRLVQGTEELGAATTRQSGFGANEALDVDVTVDGVAYLIVERKPDSEASLPYLLDLRVFGPQ